MDCSSPGVPDKPGQYGETPTLQKKRCFLREEGPELSPAEAPVAEDTPGNPGRESGLPSTEAPCTSHVQSLEPFVLTVTTTPPRVGTVITRSSDEEGELQQS